MGLEEVGGVGGNRVRGEMVKVGAHQRDIDRLAFTGDAGSIWLRHED